MPATQAAGERAPRHVRPALPSGPPRRRPPRRRSPRTRASLPPAHRTIRDPAAHQRLRRGLSAGLAFTICPLGRRLRFYPQPLPTLAAAPAARRAPSVSLPPPRRSCAALAAASTAAPTVEPLHSSTPTVAVTARSSALKRAGRRSQLLGQRERLPLSPPHCPAAPRPARRCLVAGGEEHRGTNAIADLIAAFVSVPSRPSATPEPRRLPDRETHHKRQELRLKRRPHSRYRSPRQSPSRRVPCPPRPRPPPPRRARAPQERCVHPCSAAAAAAPAAQAPAPRAAAPVAARTSSSV